MPATASSGQQRTFLTPTASPSVGPPDRPPTKRARLRSTPSSRSASNESTSSVDVNSARRTSTLRVLNVWAQLAERYNKRLDEDDIIDVVSGAIIRDRGVLRAASRDHHFAQSDDQDCPDADPDQEDSEQDDDDNELSGLTPGETTTGDDALLSTKELLRGVPPLSATTDAEDLREFLEAEKKRKGLARDEEDELDMSPGQLSTLRKALAEHARKRETAAASQAWEEASKERPREGGDDTSPTRPARAPSSDDESEDELALWTHDESTAVYPVARNESEQDVRKVEQEVIDLSESDSDAEFEALLVRPPRFVARAPPLPVPQLKKEAPQPLQSPPDSERGRSKPCSRSHPKPKPTEVVRKSEGRLHSPPVRRKPEVILIHKGKMSTSKETAIVTSDDAGSDQEVVDRSSPTCKGKGKEVSLLIEDGRQDTTRKPLGVVCRGQKRKRIASSSTSSGPSAQSPVEPKNRSRSHTKAMPQSSIKPNATPTLDEDAPTSARFTPAVSGSSRSLPLFSSSSKILQSALSVPASRSFKPDSVQPSHDLNSDSALPCESPITDIHPYPLRHPSHVPPIFPSPSYETPGTPMSTHPPSPLDPVQAQQAHYLLAQAMHQLSYVISATMPYTAYASNPGQQWLQHPPPPPLPSHSTYGPLVHLPPFAYGRPYNTPSSSISRSTLPPSSPIQSSISSPAEEQRARSRGRSKSRGRRVSFRIDKEEITDVQEYNLHSELHDGQKTRMQTREAKLEKEKERTVEESDDSSQLDARGSPAREVGRGRTPGPPGRRKVDGSRGKSLGRR